MRILYLPHQYSQQRQREKKRLIYPILLAMQAQYYRNLGHEVYWDSDTYAMVRGMKIITEPEDIDFLKLPPPDRVFTNAFDKRYQNNGNFKYHPGTYIQVANGCWWGKCEFCVEKKNRWRVRDYLDVWDEIKECERLGFKEIFDDSGTFPVGEWLENFLDCAPYKNPVLGCNMRMIDAPYEEMKEIANFRMILFGLESANQQTLDRINKGVKVEDIKYIIKAAKAGLDCHASCMFGFPNETDEDALRTLYTVHGLLKRGYLRTAQASFYTPPDGKNNPNHKKYVNRIYNVAWSPQFWMNQLKKIHDVDDIKYIWRGIKEVLWNSTR